MMVSTMINRFSSFYYVSYSQFQDANNTTTNQRELVSLEYPESCKEYVESKTEYVILNSVGLDIVGYKVPSFRDGKSYVLIGK